MVGVVAGKDLIPRLSLGSMERYRDEMVTALARCRCVRVCVCVGVCGPPGPPRWSAGMRRSWRERMQTFVG